MWLLPGKNRVIIEAVAKLKFCNSNLLKMHVS
jgi:hypothetical protein